MNSKNLSSAILVIDAYFVDVECYITGSKFPKFIITNWILEGVDEINSTHVGEAIQYRSLDRQLWLG